MIHPDRESGYRWVVNIGSYFFMKGFVMNQINDSGLQVKANGEVDLDFYLAEARSLRSQKVVQLLVVLFKRLKRCLSFDGHLPMNTRHSH